MNQQKSGIETEFKFYVQHLPEIENRLDQLGAQVLQHRQLETNLRFDTSEAGLERDNKVLRLRLDQDARMTYKGPSILVEGALRRTEYEIEVSEFETTQKLLEAIGFSISARYEKYRTTYIYQDIEIMLDELPIGTFVEIEGSDPSALIALANQLGLNTSAAIPVSYLDLFRQLSTKLGLDHSNLTFAALKELQFTPEQLGVVPA
jgi:adenylate cyclase, class 2